MKYGDVNYNMNAKKYGNISTWYHLIRQSSDEWAKPHDVELLMCHNRMRKRLPEEDPCIWLTVGLRLSNVWEDEDKLVGWIGVTYFENKR